MNVQSLLVDAQTREDEAAAAAERARKARAILQFVCPHEHVIGSKHSEGAAGSVWTPFRVCTLCGFAEESWSCGNQILSRKPERDLIPYDEALTYARGPCPRIHSNAQFVGHYAAVQAAGGQAAYVRATLLRVLGLTEDDVANVKPE